MEEAKISLKAMVTAALSRAVLNTTEPAAQGKYLLHREDVGVVVALMGPAMTKKSREIIYLSCDGTSMPRARRFRDVSTVV